MCQCSAPFHTSSSSCRSLPLAEQQAFASLYLPSLLRTFVRDTSLPKDVPVYTSFRWYGTWVLHTTRSPAFSRFFRLHTEVALRFFLSLVELVASIDADFLQVRDVSEPQFSASRVLVFELTFLVCACPPSRRPSPQAISS